MLDDDRPVIHARRSADWHGPRPAFTRYADCVGCGETVIYMASTMEQARRETGKEPQFVCLQCIPLAIARATSAIQQPSGKAFADAQEILGRDVAADFIEAMTGERPKDG